MTVLLSIYIFILLLLSCLNLLTTYHFLKYRYQGDSSKIIVFFFIVVIVILMILPFFILNYGVDDTTPSSRPIII